MSRSGHGVSCVRKAHIGGGKKESGKRQYRQNNGNRPREDRERTWNPDAVRRTVVLWLRMEGAKKELITNVAVALERRERIPKEAFQYFPDPKNPLYKNLIAHLKGLGRKGSRQVEEDELVAL